MRVDWVALLSSASLLLGSASASAQGPVPLSGMQLDNVIPAYQLDPIQYQLRVAVDAVAIAEPDRARNTLLVDDAEAQRLQGEEPEERCTPARRALLAAAGRSEAPAWQATPQQRPALSTSATPTRQAAGTAPSRLAAASPDPAIESSASPARTASAIADRGEPVRIRNTRPSAPEAAADRSRSPATRSAGAADKRAPAPAVASRAPRVEVPVRTARSESPARPSGASAVRVRSGADAADIVARVRSEVNRTLSALPAGTVRFR